MPIDPRGWRDFRSLLGQDDDAVREVVQVFLEESLDLRDRVCSGVVSADIAKWRRAAHSLKSASRHVGASELAELAATLEQHAASRDIGRAEALLPALRLAIDDVRSELQRRIGAA